MMRRLVGYALALIAGLYVAALAYLFVRQRALIYPAPRHAPVTALPGFQMVRLRAEDGLTLAAAYRAGRSDPTVVYFHGNGNDLAAADRATRMLGAAGYSLLLVEYRGYGGNPGTPSEQGLYRDGRAALAWLAAHGVASARTVLIGNSLGSGVATRLAAEQSVAGLALVSGYSSLAEVIGPHYPWVPVSLLLTERFDNRAALPRVSAPILLLHGVGDRLIAADHSRRLAALNSRARLELVPGAGHELAWLPTAQARILRWLAKIEAQSRAGGYSGGNAAASHSGSSASPSASMRRSSTIRPSSG
jgi:pimeloyl-ACP methyl ester carboxylesterase